MTDNSLQIALDGLRHQFGTVLQLCGEHPGRLALLWPGVIDDLERSLDRLRAGVRPHTRNGEVSTAADSHTDALLAKRKSAIIEASPDPVIATDYQGSVVEFNTAAEHTFGYARADAVGRQLGDLIAPPRLRAPLRVAIAEFGATGASVWLGKQLEALAVKSDGSEFHVQLAVTRIANEDPPLLVVYLRDLTARKNEERDVARYQERLRSLTAELLLAEESERRRLAIDLHDGLSQTIALAKIKLLALPGSTDVALHRSLAEIGELIDHANQSARSITFELSPPVLHDLGLEPAVEWLVEHIRTRYGLAITLEDDGKPKPADHKTRVILFRAIRELLINAAKHSGAQRVVVRLVRVDNAVQATVDDDGVGMEPEEATVGGSGLFSLRERLNHVGGSIDIDASRGRGTSICLRVPLTMRGTLAMKVKA